MAEDLGEKTEAPTGRRLSEARERGQVPKSQDLSAALDLVTSFALILLVPNLPVLVGAQIVFGLAAGLIYYSSLFYSMDVGERKSEHGGFHEAAIGAGSCAGPAIGAAAMHFFPDVPGNSAWAVSGMLIIGLAGLTWLRVRK